MSKKYAILLIAPFFLFGCLGGNGGGSEAEGIQGGGGPGGICDELEVMLVKIRVEGERLSEMTALCDTYPDKWTEAASAGASELELDAIAIEHEQCLADLAEGNRALPKLAEEYIDKHTGAGDDVRSCDDIIEPDALAQ